MFYRNKDNNSTYFTFSILFAKYKREEVGIRHVPSCYDKSQLPSLPSTQLVFFDEVHVKQVCGPPSTIRSNECNNLFPRNEEGKVDVEKGVYDAKNQPKRATFKYEQEGQFCIGVAKVESQDRTIIGKRCLVFDYKDKKIFRIDALQNRNLEQICKNKEAYFVVVTMGRKK